RPLEGWSWMPTPSRPASSQRAMNAARSGSGRPTGTRRATRTRVIRPVCSMPRLRASQGLHQPIEAKAPAVAVAAAHLVVGTAAGIEREQRARALRLECERHHRLEPLRRLGHPSVLDAPPALERQEAAIVRPVVIIKVHGMIEETVNDRIHDRLLCAEPRA